MIARYKERGAEAQGEVNKARDSRGKKKINLEMAGKKARKTRN